MSSTQSGEMRDGWTYTVHRNSELAFMSLADALKCIVETPSRGPECTEVDVDIGEAIRAGVWADIWPVRSEGGSAYCIVGSDVTVGRRAEYRMFRLKHYLDHWPITPIDPWPKSEALETVHKWREAKDAAS